MSCMFSQNVLYKHDKANMSCMVDVFYKHMLCMFDGCLPAVEFADMAYSGRPRSGEHKVFSQLHHYN